MRQLASACRCSRDSIVHELLGARLDRVGDLQQRQLALARRRVAPLLERARGRPGTRRRCRPRRDSGAVANTSPVLGSTRSVVRAVGGGDVLAVDEVAELGRSSALLVSGSGGALGGTSSAGLRSKKPNGFSQNETMSTGITGQSSGPVMWWMPNTYQSTTSVFSIGRFCRGPDRQPAVLARSGRRTRRTASARRAWYGVTHSVWPITSARSQHRRGRVEHRRERAARDELVADRRAERRWRRWSLTTFQARCVAQS